MRACPFCREADFDAVGLKVHLSSGHCEAYESTPSPARTARLGSPHPAATAREETIRAEVIEECARVCEARAAKHHGTLTEDLGESYELGWREDEGKDCAEAIRALALARSTGGS